MSSKNFIRLVLRVARRFLKIPSGQIKKHHEIGRWIELLASLPTVNNIVEIGTWNGRGSSKVIVRGVNSRKKTSRLSVKVVGYEINPIMVKASRKVLRRYPYFKVVFGSIVTIEELNRGELNSTELAWLEQDELLIRNAPNVFNTVPLNIDLLILDGGEFSTLAEFKLLSARVNSWIVLDDTHTRKCAEILDLVQKEIDFEIVYESDERHGTAILKKVVRDGR